MSRAHRVLSLVTIVVAALVAGCGGSTPSKQEAPPSAQQDSAPTFESGGILHAEPDPALPAGAASVQRITYVSRSAVDDSTTSVTGSVYLPAAAAPPGGYHVVAYGPAVSGSTPQCALSPEAKARSSAAVEALLQGGYVVTVPDYQGLGDPSDGRRLYHPALDSTTAGYNLIDAVRAAKNLVPDTSPIWAAAGEVQGGQAAWALNELADNYGLQNLVGTVSISPIADPAGLADAAAEGTLTGEQQILFMSYLSALSSEYGSAFQIDDYRRGSAKQNWGLLLGCDPGEEAARAAARAAITPDDLRPATPAALAVLRTYLRKTTLPQGPAQQPMLVMVDPQDPLMPAAWTEGALSRACAMNDQITIRTQPAPALDTEALDWIAGRIGDQPVTNDCAPFLEAHPPPPAPPPPGPVGAAPATTAPAVPVENAPRAHRDLADQRVAAGDDPAADRPRAGRRDRLAVAAVGSAVVTGRGRGGLRVDRGGVVVRAQPGVGFGLPVGNVGVDRIDRPGGGGADPGMARVGVVAAHRRPAGCAAVCPVGGDGAQRVAGVSAEPHHRLAAGHRAAAAAMDRPGETGRDAA